MEEKKMNMYETQNYLDAQIAKKEREIAELKQKRFDAQIREFYWFILDQLDTNKPEFLDSTWKISFMGRTVELNNYADVFGGIEQTLINYMEEDEIEYKRGEDE